MGALPFPPLHFSLPPLPLPFPSCSPAQPPLPRSGPQIQLGVWGRCKLPQRGLGRSPSRNRIWCILALKSVIWWQLATILMIFLRVLPKIFLWPHYAGAHELGGPGSLNRLNPRFLRHWALNWAAAVRYVTGRPRFCITSTRPISSGGIIISVGISSSSS